MNWESLNWINLQLVLHYVVSGTAVNDYIWQRRERFCTFVPHGALVLSAPDQTKPSSNLLWSWPLISFLDCINIACWSPRPLVEFSPGNYPYILERCSASIDLPTAITAIFRTREACVLWSCEIVFVFVYVYTHECLVYIDDRGWRLFSKASAYSGGSTGGNSVIDGTMHAISTDSDKNDNFGFDAYCVEFQIHCNEPIYSIKTAIFTQVTFLIYWQCCLRYHFTVVMMIL